MWTVNAISSRSTMTCQINGFCSPMWTVNAKFKICTQAVTGVEWHKQAWWRIKRDTDRAGPHKTRGHWLKGEERIGRCGRRWTRYMGNESWVIKQDHPITGTHTCTQTEGWRKWNQPSRHTGQSGTVITWGTCDMGQVKQGQGGTVITWGTCDMSQVKQGQGTQKGQEETA